MNISACLVTRGDVDITTILNSLPFDDVVVWNNKERDEDLACYGRFAAIAEAKHDIIYVQDDDLMVPIPALVKAYDGVGIVANKPVEEEWRFLGCGALFHRDLANFDQYLALYPEDPEFHRTADVAFAYQHPYRSVWLGYLDFPWQTAENRMYKQTDHYIERRRTRARTLELQPQGL
jgi:hypothetical protein